MERSEIIAAVLGLGVGLVLGWFVWRFRSLSREGISRLEDRLETTERRLARSEKQRSDLEIERDTLEVRVAEEREAFDELVASTTSEYDDDSDDDADLDGGIDDEIAESGATAVRPPMPPMPPAPPRAPVPPMPPVPPALAGRPVVSTDDAPAESVAGLSSLGSDAARVDELSSRLVQSQLWLEEAEERAVALQRQLDAERTQSSVARKTANAASTRLSLTKEALVAADAEVRALTNKVNEHEAIISGTKKSIGRVQREAQRANDTVNGIIDLRSERDFLDDDEADLSTTARLLADKQAEVAELRSKVDSFDVDVEERSKASQARLVELEADLASAQSALDAVGDAPERAAQLQDEVARLRALVADHSLERDRLGNQLTQRDQIDLKLDALFVEIHELRGRSAALRTPASNTPASN